MPSTGTTNRPIAMGAFLVLCAVRPPLLAQPDVRVLAGDVTDSRFSGGYRTGRLSLKVKVRGDGMEGVQALRFLLADARDDLGNPLLRESKDTPAFRDVRGDRAEETLSLRNPARDASSFSASGRVELLRGKGEKRERMKVDVDNIMRAPGENADVSLKPDDIIFVPQRLF